MVIYREIKLVRLARAFSACLQGDLLLPSALSSNLSFLVFSFVIHVQSSNSGYGKREAFKKWSVANLERHHPVLELP